MRGRTNASNGGIYLNATTDNFEVATGNSIVAGDFVEYHYATDVIPLNSTFNQNGRAFLVDSTTHTYIALIGTYPTLFTYIDGEITIIQTYSTACGYMEQFNATHYLIHNSSTSKVALIECTTSTITLVDEYSSAQGNTVGMVHIDATNIALLRSTGYLYIFSASNNYTELAYKASATITGSNLAFIGASESKIVVYVYTNNYGSAKIYDATDATLLDSITLSYSNYKFAPNIVIDERYFIAYSSDSSQNVYIAVIDIDDKQEGARTKFSDNGNSSLYYTSDINANNEFIMYQNSSNKKVFWWFKFNDSLLSFEISEPTNATSPISTPAIYTFGSKTYGYMISTSGYQNLTTYTNTVIVGTQTDKVEEWSGSGNPMGVAKQSGSAGDTIAVYIPSTNS